MTREEETLLQLIGHVLNRHPALANSIAKMASAKVAELRFANLPTRDVFRKIYNQGCWGKSEDSTQPFFSGTGSHDQKITTAYIQAVKGFLQTLPAKPHVVDLGCGDFSIGSQLRAFCEDYIACDIVPELIEFNRRKYAALGVDFRILDIISDELPPGEVVFVRQVLQHLSNSQIQKILPKIQQKYRYLVFTDHLPPHPGFKHNLDHPPGPGIRLGLNSGVVLPSPPFTLKAHAEKVLCEVPEMGGIIRTILYSLAGTA